MTNASRLVTRHDLEAFAELVRNEDASLKVSRARAEKWLGWTTALPSALGVALIIKGPEGISALERWAQIACALGIALVYLLLGGAMYLCYRAAYGSPGQDARIDPDPLSGLRARLDAHRAGLARQVRSDIKVGVVAITLASIVLGVVIALSWIGATKASTPLACPVAGSNVVVLTSGPCPTVPTPRSEPARRP